MFSFVVATDKNGVMGSSDGGLPWGRSQKSDLKRYRELTEYHTIIMGHTTYKELPEPLTNRHHVVITHKPEPSEDSRVEFMTFEQVLEKFRDLKEELFVIGGSKVFDLFFPYAETMYVTIIDAEYNGDVYFPDFDKTIWKKRSEKHFKADSSNLENYIFQVYSKVLG